MWIALYLTIMVALCAISVILVIAGLATIFKRRLSLSKNWQIVGTPAVLAGFGIFGTGAAMVSYFLV